MCWYSQSIESIVEWKHGVRAKNRVKFIKMFNNLCHVYGAFVCWASKYSSIYLYFFFCNDGGGRIILITHSILRSILSILLLFVSIPCMAITLDVHIHSIQRRKKKKRKKRRKLEAQRAVITHKWLDLFEYI